jgi:hypothetical protein
MSNDVWMAVSVPTHRVSAHAVGDLADRRGSLLAALLDDVGGAELPGNVLAGLVPRHDHHLLGAHHRSCQHAAQAHGAVADHDRSAAFAYVGRNRRMPAGGHHVGEREQ